MAQTKNLGKVTITPRGVYSPSSAYERLDAVTYDGSSWLALQNVTGLAPTPGQYWMLISAKGDKGDTGDVGGTITVDGVSEVGGNIQLNAVRYSAMSLSAANKKNARENIDAQEVMTIDTAMSDSSTNAVQNSTITDYIESSFSAVYNSTATAIFDSVGPAEIVSISDGADGMDARSVVVAFSPIQAGTGDPSHDNVRPISGRTGLTVWRTGANIWDEQWELGGIDADGNPDSTTNKIRSKNYIDVQPDTTYYCYFGGSGGIGIHCYNSQKTKINGGGSLANNSFTTPSDCFYLKFACTTGYGTTYSNNISINYPSTLTAYYPGYVDSYSVNWQSVAGTVYSGTLDLVSGVLTVDMVMVVFDGTNGTFKEGTINYLRYDPISSLRPNYSRRTETVSNQYYIITNGATTDQSMRISTDSVIILVYDSRFTTESTMRTLLSQNPVQIVYPLKTENIQTYQLTPQQIQMLLGANNIWSTGDTVELTYPCDTKLYIDEKTAALLAILSE